MTDHTEQQQIQQTIMRDLGVVTAFDARAEMERRIEFLCTQLQQTGLRTLVLGISGGVDSFTAGLLSQTAVARARERGHDARFIAMRLPYGVQKDEDDAQQCLQVIQPDTTLAVDIKPASDGMLAALKAAGQTFNDPAHEDFVLGNIKARERMIAQFAVAGATRGLVVGTDQGAEALMGFFTKFGDGACDVAPLTGLTKRQVRAIAKLFNAPERLVYKTPTADLESLAPQKPDETALGVSYEAIDDFLEGKPIGDADFQTILKQYRATAHKRALPITPQAF